MAAPPLACGLNVFVADRAEAYLAPVIPGEISLVQNLLLIFIIAGLIEKSDDILFGFVKPYAGCVWTIQPDESMLNKKVYFANSTMWDRVDGDSCRVSAVDDKTLNGHTVTLTVQAPDGNSQDSVVIKVVDA